MILQHWRTLHKLLFAHPTPEQYQRLWKITWTKLAAAPKRWALVKGPVAALVAYLQDLGVDASDPAIWRFPSGSLQGPGLWNFSQDTVSVSRDSQQCTAWRKHFAELCSTKQTSASPSKTQEMEPNVVSTGRCPGNCLRSRPSVPSSPRPCTWCGKERFSPL